MLLVCDDGCLVVSHDQERVMIVIGDKFETKDYEYGMPTPYPGSNNIMKFITGLPGV